MSHRRPVEAILKICLLPACLLLLHPLLAGPVVAAPATLELAVEEPVTVVDPAADAATLPLAAAELRGLAELGDGRTLVLVASPDTLRASAAALLWLDGSGRIQREHDVSGVLSRGLAFDGRWIWGLQDATPESPALLHKIEGDTLYVAESYPTPGHAPRDLAWDGHSVWLVDRDLGRLDRFDPETEEVTRSRTTPGFSPTGLAWDGRQFWISDEGTGRLYQVAAGGGRWTGTVSSEAFFRRGAETALGWSRHRLWLLRGDGLRAAPCRRD